MASKSYSIVEYYSEQKNYKCGYCKSPNSSFSHGMWAHTLTVQDYENLLDRGWRRSGSYCYKPLMDQTCCPAYTIRCEALDLKISKSQKKILKKMANFLNNKLNKAEENASSDLNVVRDDKLEIADYEVYATKADANASKMNVTSVSSEINERLLGTENNSVKRKSKDNASTESITSSKTADLSTFMNEKLNKKKVMGFDPKKKLLKKAKLLRLERKQNKLLSQGKSNSEIETILKERKQHQNCSKTLEELFSNIDGETNKLEMRLVKTAPKSSEYLSTEIETFQLFEKYEKKIHGKKEVKMDRYRRFLVTSPLQLKLVRVMSDEFLETLDESANLYKKYQMTIHGDEPEECDKSSFFNFLVKSPLQKWCPEDGPPQGYGSFHEQYWLNGQLIAVGVIDILPSCISSVYFFYDPAYSHLSLGTFSTLHEILLTRQLNRTVPNLRYYYMGFYIHICPKMRYKARMTPSKLLCPETYSWCDIEKCLPKLDANKYSRLNEDIELIDEDGIINTEEILVLYRERAMSFGTYKRRLWLTEEENEVREYGVLVGMKCAKSILLYRNCSL